MNSSSLMSSIHYGQHLIEHGVSGLRDGSESYLKGEPLPRYLRHSAVDCIPVAMLGAAASIFPSLIIQSRQNRKRVALMAVAGSGLCFVAALAWTTRNLARSMNESVQKQIRSVVDEHWLAQHPIDYA